MKVIGLIPAFNEEGNIGDAVRSLYRVGCDHVVVLDGAYQYDDGSSFMGGGILSSDATVLEAHDAGAVVLVSSQPLKIGQKREHLLRNCGAKDGDHVVFLDADERAMGRLPVLDGHANVVLRNLKPNDLPDMRAMWPHGDAGPLVPLLRVLRWSPGLRFVGFGRFIDEAGPVKPYDADALRADPNCDIREASALPLLEGFEIHHLVEATPERVEAKRKAYARA